MYMILIPVLALGYWVSRMIKKHITWPRTGYVAYGVDAHSVGGSNAKAKMSFWTARVVVGVVAAVVAASFACLIMLGTRHHLMSLTRTGYLAFWVPVYAFWVFQMGRKHRWKWLVLLFMALGLLMIGLVGPGDFIEMSRPVMLFVGLVWVISGVATLCLYIRHNQPPAPETE
jgi:drug/metabolite transporter (DMT)-like permease